MATVQFSIATLLVIVLALISYTKKSPASEDAEKGPGEFVWKNTEHEPEKGTKAMRRNIMKKDPGGIFWMDAKSKQERTDRRNLEYRRTNSAYKYNYDQKKLRNEKNRKDKNDPYGMFFKMNLFGTP